MSDIDVDSKDAAGRGASNVDKARGSHEFRLGPQPPASAHDSKIRWSRR